VAIIRGQWTNVMGPSFRPPCMPNCGSYDVEYQLRTSLTTAEASLATTVTV